MNGARLAWSRLASPVGALVLAFAVSFVLLAAALERRASLALAADRTLLGAVFGLVVPLFAFAVLERVTARARLDAATNELGRFGFSRRGLSLGMLAAAAGTVSAASAVLAAVGVLAARAPDPGTTSDILTSAWIGLVAGMAYSAWFLLGSTFGAHGGGRSFALILDWIFGSTTSWLAVPFPRGHLRNLLGSDPVLDMPQVTALIALAALSMIYATSAVFRVRD